MGRDIPLRDVEVGPQERPDEKNTSEVKRAYDDPEDQIWSVYNRETMKVDQALVERWQGDMDGLLIFAGLFSAVITAFIIENYKSLKADSGDTTVALLNQISLQLAASANDSQLTLPSPSLVDTPFTVAPSAVRVNMCWFLSLTLSLATALAATLVQQWSRYYLQAIQRRDVPRVKARIRYFLHDGVEYFKLTAVVEAVPALLHAALFLFLGGLVEFLVPLNHAIGYVMLGAVVACGALYTGASILPVFMRDCPYRSPFTGACWILCRTLHLLYHPIAMKWDVYYNEIFMRTPVTNESFQDAQEVDALLRTPSWAEREVAALEWTLNSLTDHSELQPFIEGIPGYLDSGFVGNRDVRSKCLEILFADGTILSRMANVLVSAQKDDSPFQAQRALAIFKVAFLLTMHAGERLKIGSFLAPRGALLFTQIGYWCGETTDPILRHYAHCVMTSVLPMMPVDDPLKFPPPRRPPFYYWKNNLELSIDEAQQALEMLQDVDFREVALEREVAALTFVVHVGYLLAHPAFLDHGISKDVLVRLHNLYASCGSGERGESTMKVDHLLMSLCARLGGLDPYTLGEDPKGQMNAPDWITEVVLDMLRRGTIVEEQVFKVIKVLEKARFSPAISNLTRQRLHEFKKGEDNI